VNTPDNRPSTTTMSIQFDCAHASRKEEALASSASNSPGRAVNIAITDSHGIMMEIKVVRASLPSAYTQNLAGALFCQDCLDERGSAAATRICQEVLIEAITASEEGN